MPINNHVMYPYVPNRSWKDDTFDLSYFNLSFQWGKFVLNVMTLQHNFHHEADVFHAPVRQGYTFHFVRRGKGKYHLNGSTYLLYPGYFFVAPPNASYKVEVNANQSMYEYTLTVDFVASNRQLFQAEWMTQDSDQCKQLIDGLPPQPMPDSYGAMHYFTVAYQAVQHQHAGIFTTLQHAITQILLRGASVQSRSGRSKPSTGNLLHQQRYNDAIHYIRKHYNTDITLVDVASELYISTRLMQRIFRDIGGHTFKEYLDNLRLQHVCQDLQKSAEPVHMLAEKHGYSSSNYLHRVFKKRMNMTPTQYRSQIRTIS